MKWLFWLVTAPLVILGILPYVLLLLAIHIMGFRTVVDRLIEWLENFQRWYDERLDKPKPFILKTKPCASAQWAGSSYRCPALADPRCGGGNCSMHCREHCGAQCARPSKRKVELVK